MTTTGDYNDILNTLSEGSVHKHFDAFADIAWDDPEFAVVPNDPRWVLPKVDPLGGHEWYLSQPLERQIEIGMARQACIAKVGWQFESVLIRGILEYTFWSKNKDPQFRYLMHEVTEETHHIQMFQELVNRIGVDTPGARSWFKWIQTFLPLAGRWLPAIFITGVLAGEEPIDHVQKSIIRAGTDMHPLLRRVMQIHIAEEARHISWAHEYLKRTAARMDGLNRFVFSLAFPVVMRVLCDIIVKPTPEFRKQFGIPRTVLNELYFKSPESRKLLQDLFADVRMLAEEAELMNPASRQVWKLLKIDGRPARYRSEPARAAA
jgi:hypothetical protein